MPEAQTGSIEGTFKHAGTEMPIPGVCVELHKGNSTFKTTVFTDEDGHFLIEGLSHGHYILHPHREGYLQPHSIHVKVNAEQPNPVLNLSLNPAATIRGRILNSDGQPVRGRVVEFLRFVTDQQGRTAWQSRAGAPTNDNGEYRYFMLDPGEYGIRLSAMTVSAATPDSVADAPVTYFPGTMDASAAIPITTIAETEAIADFTVPAVKTYRICGKTINAISNADHLPLLGLSLVSREADGPVEREPTFLNRLSLPKESNGSFEVRGVRAGSYNLVIDGHTSSNDYLSKVPVDVRDKDVEGVVVVLRAGTDITGRLVVAGGQDSGLRLAAGPLATMPPIREGENRVIVHGFTSSGSRSDIRLNLSRKDGLRGGRYSIGPLVDESGTAFTFPDVPEGAYTISARGMPLMSFGSDTYLADMRVGGRSVFDDGLIVVGTDPVDTIEIVVGTNGGSVQVTVSGKENQKALLILIPDPPRRSNDSHFRLITISESHGECTLRGIAPGNYTLLAIAGDDRSIPYRSPAFLATHESRGVAVTIQEGVQVGVQLLLI